MIHRARCLGTFSMVCAQTWFVFFFKAGLGMGEIDVYDFWVPEYLGMSFFLPSYMSDNLVGYRVLGSQVWLPLNSIDNPQFSYFMVWKRNLMVIWFFFPFVVNLLFSFWILIGFHSSLTKFFHVAFLLAHYHHLFFKFLGDKRISLASILSNWLFLLQYPMYCSLSPLCFQIR